LAPLWELMNALLAFYCMDHALYRRPLALCIIQIDGLVPLVFSLHVRDRLLDWLTACIIRVNFNSGRVSYSYICYLVNWPWATNIICIDILLRSIAHISSNAVTDVWEFLRRTVCTVDLLIVLQRKRVLDMWKRFVLQLAEQFAINASSCCNVASTCARARPSLRIYTHTHTYIYIYI